MITLALESLKLVCAQAGYRCDLSQMERVETSKAIIVSLLAGIRAVAKRTAHSVEIVSEVEAITNENEATISHIVQIIPDNKQSNIADFTESGLPSLIDELHNLLKEVEVTIKKFEAFSDSTRPAYIGIQENAPIPTASELVATCATKILAAQPKRPADEEYRVTIEGTTYDLTANPKIRTTHHMGTTTVSGYVTKPCHDDYSLVLVTGKNERLLMGFPEELMETVDHYYIGRKKACITHDVYHEYYCGRGTKKTYHIASIGEAEEKPPEQAKLI